MYSKRAWGRGALLRVVVVSACLFASEGFAADPAAERLNGPLELSPRALEAAGKRRPESVADLRAIQDQVRRVVDQVRPTVVAVQIRGSMGSGVIVSEDGLVLTAGHVVVKPKLPVTFFFPDGSRARGIALGMNSAIDSGMLRITDPGPWPFTPTAEPGATRRGDWVVTLGQANGFFDDRQPPVRLGRVLSVDDEVIQTDCTLVGGDSGGPLVNLRGEVVGIHSRIARPISSNFHVPIAAFRQDWGRLLVGQQWGGRGGRDTPVDYQPWLGFSGGMHSGEYRIGQVQPGMPAAKAGVRRGDILRAFDSEPIRGLGDLARELSSKKPESRIVLDIERDGQSMRIELQLGKIAPGYPGALLDPRG